MLSVVQILIDSKYLNKERNELTRITNDAIVKYKVSHDQHPIIKLDHKNFLRGIIFSKMATRMSI